PALRNLWKAGRRGGRLFRRPCCGGAVAGRPEAGSWSGIVNSEPSVRLRRYLAVWFPWLPSDRLRRQEQRDGAPPEDAPPIVLAEKIKGALRLAAVDPASARAGLTPGLALADARARTPALRVVAHRPDLDDALLGWVLEDFGRFTPMIALDPPHGLMLDVTGCAHLFGGE